MLSCNCNVSLCCAAKCHWRYSLILGRRCIIAILRWLRYVSAVFQMHIESQSTPGGRYLNITTKELQFVLVFEASTCTQWLAIELH